MTVLSPRGFVASATAAGIKPDGRLDLVAGRRARTPGRCRSQRRSPRTSRRLRLCRSPVPTSPKPAVFGVGVILNSGCANSATGCAGSPRGRTHVSPRRWSTRGERPEHFLVCSTGTIGTRLAVERIEAALPTLIAGRGRSPDHAAAAAKAILTTDTRIKEVLVEADGFVVGGMAKGCRDALTEHGDDARHADD